VRCAAGRLHGGDDAGSGGLENQPDIGDEDPFVILRNVNYGGNPIKRTTVLQAIRVSLTGIRFAEFILVPPRRLGLHSPVQHAQLRFVFQPEMAADTPHIYDDVEDCIDGIIQTVGNLIVLALQLGLGKAYRITNALYRRVAVDPKLHLTIVTALSLERPRSHNDLEKRFMDPLMDRIFGDSPELAYLAPVRTNSLPANIVFMEFFLNPGKCLNNDNEQQNYISSNYTHVVRDLLALGVNVCAQMVSREETDGKTWYSLRCNSDLTLDLVRQMRAPGQQNRRMAVAAEIVQRLVNEGKITPRIDKSTLAVLLEAGAVHPQLDHPDVDWLRKFGIFKETITYEDGSIRVNPDLLIDADLTKGGGMDAVVQHCLGDRLKEGIVMHGGFFLGPHKFYESLRNMDAVERKKFCMTSVMFVNQLYGNPSLATLQRTDARYFNTCMMMTMGGAACSDGLENGKVVSGMGSCPGITGFRMSSGEISRNT